MIPRQRLRRSCFRVRRLKTRDYMLILTVAFITSFLTFSITFYLNSNSLIIFINYLRGVVRPSYQKPPFLASNTGLDYHPREFKGKSNSEKYDYYIVYNDFDYRRNETLTYRTRIYSNNTKILIRFPEKVPMTSLLFIFHSCQHSAYDWFSTPERQRIIGAAINLGYACLVFQSTDNHSRCWANQADIYENKDVQMVFKGLEEFFKEYPALISLPRFTFGESSGGIFSSILAINRLYEIQGQILFASIILPEILYTYVKPKSYPITVWIHMLRDNEFASEERINISKQIFLRQEIPHQCLPVEPIALSHSTFFDRIPSITSETSYFIYYRLYQHRWINFFQFLKYNPRRKLTWKDFLFPTTPPHTEANHLMDNLKQNQRIISEFLNTAYGEHEISFERSYEALKWLKESYLSAINKTNSVN